MLVALLAGCSSNRIAGTIAGYPVPVESAYLRVESGAFEDDDLVLVRLTSIPQSCAVWQFYEEQSAQATTPEELADAWASAFPVDFWVVDFVARVPGGSWPPKDRDWIGLAWDEYPEKANTVFATFDHNVAWRDAAWFNGEVADEDEYVHRFYSDSGLVRWGGGVPAQRLAGKMNTNTRDGNGGFMGRVMIHFDAKACPVVATAGTTPVASGP